MKYLNFILTTIAICLVYIAFLKPLPQRYIIKEEKETSQEIYTETVSVFDTATGKQYKKDVTTIAPQNQDLKIITTCTRWDFIKNTGTEMGEPKIIRKLKNKNKE